MPNNFLQITKTQVRSLYLNSGLSDSKVPILSPSLLPIFHE